MRIEGNPEKTQKHGIHAFSKDRKNLRDFLSRLSSGEQFDRQVAESQANAELKHAQAFFVVENGRFKTRVDFAGVGAINAIAMAFLLDKTRGLTADVKVCPLADCGKFFLGQAGRRGQVRKFCSSECYRTNDREAAKERAKKSRESHGAQLKRKQKRKEN